MKRKILSVGKRFFAYGFLAASLYTYSLLKVNAIEEEGLRYAVMPFLQQQEGIDNLCTREANTLAEWCGEMYFGTILEFMGMVEAREAFTKVCAMAEESGGKYEPRLQHFLEHLDSHPEVRSALEEKLYESTNEIIVDVQQMGRDFRLHIETDPSDPIFHRYLTQLQQEPSLEDALLQMQEGEPQAGERFLAEAVYLLSSYTVQTSFEERILDDLRGDLGNGDAPIASFVLFTAMEGQSIRREEEAREKIVLSKLYAFAAKIPSKYDMAQAAVQLEHLKHELADYKKSQQELQATRRRRDEYAAAVPHRVWGTLFSHFLTFKVVRDVSHRTDDSFLAEGHSHPLYQESGEAKLLLIEPSTTDREGAFRKPRLVFTALPERWLVYTIICGESRLAREYERTMAKSL